MSGDARHGRQSRLAEVGPAGQARLAQARVAIELDGLAARVAARYLAGAGVGHLVVRTAALAGEVKAVDPGASVTVVAGAPGAPGAPGAYAPGDERLEFHDFRDPSAREVAHGALTALRAILGVLGTTRSAS